MHPVILIPARYASTRLPGKPLADIGGMPMILHVLERARAAAHAPIIVATDHEAILEAVENAGGRAVMTPSELPSGSDRIWHALQQVDPEGAYDTIINLQGDLPTLDPALIGEVVAPLANPETAIATLVAPASNAAEEQEPSVVKPVVAWQDEMQRQGIALYFSRQRLPHGDGEVLHHIGIYAYRREALAKFVALPPSPLELREKLEQLRALEAGMQIGVRRVDTVPFGVDTPEQLEQARRMLA